MNWYVAILFFLIIPCLSISQDYKFMQLQKGHSFEDIVLKTDRYFESKGTGKHTGYKQYERWKYWSQRALKADGSIRSQQEASLAYSTFQEQNQNQFRVASNDWMEMGPITSNKTSTWSSHLGRVSAIAMDANNDHHILVGSPNGGVWKTCNQGQSWIPITDNLSNLEVFALAISPANSQHYYCGNYGMGILRSTNGGLSWYASSGIPSSAWINRIIVHPLDPNIVLATCETGKVYRSTNGGNSFYTVLSMPLRAFDLEFNTDDPNIVYASGEGRFYISYNAGASFSYNAISNQLEGPVMLAVTPHDSAYIYLLEAKNGGFSSLWLSDNAGASFILKSYDDDQTYNNLLGSYLSGSGGQAPRDMDIVVSPYDKTEVHVGGLVTFRSLDSGSSWEQTSHWYLINNTIGFIHADIDIMLYSGNKIYFGTDGGIFQSADKAENFTDLSAGLGIRQFYRIGVSKSDPDVIAGGSQDNGSSIFNTNRWVDFIGADGTEIFIDHSNNNIAYGSIQYGKLHKTTNGGLTHVDLDRDYGSGNWVTPVEQDPISSSTLYVGTDQLYKSTNGGFTWNAISNFNESGKIYEMKIAPSNRSTIYVAFKSSVYRTTNGGSSWYNISPGGSYNVNYIAVHPTNSSRVCLALSGSYTKLFESSNSGSSWQNISGNLPNLTAECVVYDGSSTYSLYAGMDPGVYHRSGSSNSWSIAGSSLPNSRITELEVSGPYLFAASYGRGIWRLNLSGASSGTDIGWLDGSEHRNQQFIQTCPINPCDDISFQISGAIPDNSQYRAEQYILSDGILAEGLSSSFRAIDYILLQAGFEVQSTAVINIEIGPCND